MVFNKIIFGIVFFVLFGRFSAAVEIKTYRNVANGTLFQQNTDSDMPSTSQNNTLFELGPDGLVFSETVMKDVEKTYAVYALNHLAFINFLMNRPTDPDYFDKMSMNLKYYAKDVIDNCKFTLRNIHRTLPSWMEMFSELLEAIKFDRELIVYAEELKPKIKQIQSVLMESVDDFRMKWPSVHLTETLLNKNNFLLYLRELKDSYFGLYVQKKCENLTLNDVLTHAPYGQCLSACQSITILYYTFHNLSELQTILYLNRIVLPYK